MKEKMERFARGEFDDSLPKIELPKEPLSWEMEPERQFTGILRFRSENDLRLRGYVLCTDGNQKPPVDQCDDGCSVSAGGHHFPDCIHRFR